MEAGRSSFVIRVSATRCVECFQYPTLEVFDASCSRGFIRTIAEQLSEAIRQQMQPLQQQQEKLEKQQVQPLQQLEKMEDQHVHLTQQ